MRYVNTISIKNLNDDFKDKYIRREVIEEKFYGINHGFENCIIIPTDIKVSIDNSNNNIVICNNNPKKISKIIEEINNKVDADNNVCKLIFQETFLNEIDRTESLFILQCVRAFETYKLNGLTPLCAYVAFDKMSDRYTVSLYLSVPTNKNEKIIEKIYNEML